MTVAEAKELGCTFAKYMSPELEQKYERNFEEKEMEISMKGIQEFSGISKENGSILGPKSLERDIEKEKKPAIGE